MIKNSHQLAIEIAKREGGKKKVNIAQIKEIVKITDELLSEHTEKYIKGVSELPSKKNSAKAKPAPATPGLIIVKLPAEDIAVLRKVISNNK